MYTKNNALKKKISDWLIIMFFIISIMIIVGGLTRLTDSGLSITEWQLFSGFLPPFNSNDWNHYFNLYKSSLVFMPFILILFLYLAIIKNKKIQSS